MSAALVTPELDLADPAFVADPWPYYAELRETGPFHRPGYDDYLLARHEHVVAVLRDTRFSSDPRNARGPTKFEGAEGDIMKGALGALMLFVDPPDHTRIRGLVNKAFTPRTVEAMRPHIHDIVTELLDAAEAKGPVIDVMADLAYPLPVIVVAEMLGVPAADRDLFKSWAGDLAKVVDVELPPEIMTQAIGAGMQFIQYMHALIAERKANPQDDLLSALIEAESEGDRLAPQELIANSLLILIAGHETTMNLIGNGTLALLKNPQEMDRWRADPGLDRSAVEELLRYDGPVQLTARTALDAVEVGDVTVEKGQRVVALLGGANRDPGVFVDPDRLDLGRADNRHVAFGQGIHFCLGAPLARVEAQITLSTLIRRYPALALQTEKPEYRHFTTLRGLNELSVHI